MKKLLTSTFAAVAIAGCLSVSGHTFQSYQVNGTTYSFPDVDDIAWGQNVTDWAGAVSAGTLQKSGGAFTLRNEVDFGSAYGLKGAWWKSKALIVASSGPIRLGATDYLSFRNNANTADNQFGQDSSDRPTWNNIALATAASGSYAIDTSTNPQSKAGRLGVGSTATPTSTSTVFGIFNTTGQAIFNGTVANSTFASVTGYGPIVSTGANGGYYFPDGSFQTTAASTGSASTGAGQKQYAAVIGTVSINGATHVGTSSVPFINVVKDLCGSSNAVVCASAVQVFVQPGVYAVTNATIPTNMRFVFASSAVVTNGLVNDPTFTQYGETWYANYDFWENTTRKTPHIDYKSGYKQYYARILRLAMEGTTNAPTPFRIQNVVDGLDYGTFLASPTATGANDPQIYLIDGSTRITIDHMVVPSSAASITSTTESLFFLKGGGHISIVDSYFSWNTLLVYSALSSPLNQFKFARNTVTDWQSDTGAGFMTFQTSVAGMQITSGSVIDANTFSIIENGSKFLITLYDAASVGERGWMIQNNVVTSIVGTNAYTFVKIFHSTIVGTILTGNKMTGIATFLTDAGTATQKATLGNFVDTVQQ